jgi:excisionase family DNA binding protein
MGDDRLMYPSEAAAMLRVSTRTLAGWAKNGRLPSVLLPGGQRRYYRADILRLLSPPGCDGSSG